MDHPGSNVVRKFYRASAICLLAALGGIVYVSGAAAQRAVPTEFQGKWVPSKASCESAGGTAGGRGSTDPCRGRRNGGKAPRGLGRTERPARPLFYSPPPPGRSFP